MTLKQNELLVVYTIIVYTEFVKNVTLSGDDSLIEKARQVAKAEGKTLNAAFREWLVAYTARTGNVQEYLALMDRLKHIDAGRRFSRDEMNER